MKSTTVFVADRRIYLDDEGKVCAADSPNRRTLLVAPGGTLPMEQAVRLGLAAAEEFAPGLDRADAVSVDHPLYGHVVGGAPPAPGADDREGTVDVGGGTLDDGRGRLDEAGEPIDSRDAARPNAGLAPGDDLDGAELGHAEQDEAPGTAKRARGRR